MFNFLKKKRLVETREDLPYVKFELLPTEKGNLKVEVVWPKEDGFNKQAFVQLLYLIVLGKFRKEVFEKSISLTAAKNNDSAYAEELMSSLNKNILESTEVKQRAAITKTEEDDQPIITADKVTNTHFAQQNVVVQSGG